MEEESVRSAIFKQVLMADPVFMDRLADRLADRVIRDLGADECRRLLLTC